MLKWSDLQRSGRFFTFMVVSDTPFKPVVISVLRAHVFVGSSVVTLDGLAVSVTLRYDMVRQYGAWRVYWLLREDVLEYDEYESSVLPPCFEAAVKQLLGGRAA